MSLLVPGVGQPRWRTRGGGADGSGCWTRVYAYDYVYVFTFNIVVYCSTLMMFVHHDVCMP